MSRLCSLFLSLCVTAGVLAACSSNSSEAGTAGDAKKPVETVALTFVTHDSFAISEGVFEAFFDQTGIRVEVLTSGDVGSLVAQTILSADNPVGDVIFGVDNTFMQRVLDRSILEPYETSELVNVPERFQLDSTHRLIPIDYGDVCVNYWIDALDGPPPESIMDLVLPEFAGSLVVHGIPVSHHRRNTRLGTILGPTESE